MTDVQSRPTLQGCDRRPGETRMSQELYYEDFDPDYNSKIFRARKALLDSIQSKTQLPENGLSARRLLTNTQLDMVSQIRERRLKKVIHQFQPD